VNEETRFGFRPDHIPAAAMASGHDELPPVKNPMRKNRCYKIGKRAMDLVLGTAVVLLLLPLMILIGLAIKMDSPGPVVFRQKRCGLGGKEFSMLKFRTMIHKAEAFHPQLRAKNEVDGPMFKMSNDPRVTRTGRLLRKTSLDELPQLFNVLKGEMSFVGPRPLKMEEMTFNPCWRDLRLRVTPGITGLWQIHSKHRVTFHDWIHYDSLYIQEQSIGLDLMILFKTLKITFRR
jgi:lipopolysaccharide/colanic/teichoic acid biosynthesis glycosyltransferase